MTFLLLLVALIALLYLGMPMFAALFLLPLGVLYYVEGGVPALGEMVTGKLDGYLLVAIPLFMLKAHIMVRGKVVDDLYAAAFALLRGVRGGVGIATVAACTVFAAITGSSVATALTVGKIAIFNNNEKSPNVKIKSDRPTLSSQMRTGALQQTYG